MRDPSILIIKAGDKLDSLSDVSGDFEDWIIAAMQLPRRCFKVVPVYQGQQLPASDTIDAVVISGSSAMVTDLSEWIALTQGWLMDAIKRGIPVLGICFGHQLLAQALGGHVADNPDGVEVGTVDVMPTDAAATDVLFSGLGNFQAQASHRQAVLQLPAGARVLAKTAMDSYHAFRFADCCWGVQFHPEFDAEIVRHYIDHYVDDINSSSRDPDQMKRQCSDTPLGTALLTRFAQIIGTDS